MILTWRELGVAALLLAVGGAALAQTPAGTLVEQPVEGVLEPTGELVAKPDAPPTETIEETVDKEVEKSLEAAEEQLKQTD